MRVDHSKTKPETRLAAELGSMLAVSPGESAFHARFLCKIGRTLRKIAENECNGWPREISEHRDGKLYRYSVENAEWRAREEKKRDQLEDTARTLAKVYGGRIAIEFGHDPRGPALRLHMPRDLTIAAE